MPFDPSRITELMAVKGVSHPQLVALTGVSQPQIHRHTTGKAANSSVIEQIANALDSTLDYLHGRGATYRDATEAAVFMAYDVFCRDRRTTPEQQARCRRVMSHPAAPRTAEAWRYLAEQIDLAIGPTGDGKQLHVVRS